MRAIFLLFLAASFGVHANPVRVDLDRPGALEAIEKENPAHYRKIVDIIRVAADQSCLTAPQLMQIEGARGTDCRAMAIMTSDPPKKRLVFRLDDVQYVTVVTLTGPKGKVIPAR